MKNKDKANKKSKQHKDECLKENNNNSNEIREFGEKENLSITQEKENSNNFLSKMGNLLNEQLDDFDNLPFIYNINKNLFDSNNFIFSFIRDLKSNSDIKYSLFEKCTYTVKDFLIINVAEDIIEIKKFINGKKLNSQINNKYFKFNFVLFINFFNI